jgi:hypothetical protein
VLDYGCGKMPYERLVYEHGGEYHGFDRALYPANQVGNVGDPSEASGSFDTILCTQVLQYAPHPSDLLQRFHARTSILVLTYPTNWPEVQEVDFHRFTKAGMARLLTYSGFSILRHDRRATINSTGYEWALGYGCVARA